MNDGEFIAKSAELADELEGDSGPRAMVRAVETYYQLTRAATVQYTDPVTGEIIELSLKAYEALVASSKAEVKRLMRANHETRVELEGLPPITLRPGSGTWSWSLDNWYASEKDRADLVATLEHGAGAINLKLARALTEAGVIPPTWKRYGHQGGRDDALTWEERR